LCTHIIPTKHKPKEREIKLVKVEEALENFQGDKEVERGKRKKKQQPKHPNVWQQRLWQ